MAAGPGKYDDVATMAREQTRANALVLIVVEGAKGSGFSVQSIDRDVTAILPEMLRGMADTIEADLRSAGLD